MTLLPRLLYIGDVPVESSTGGSALLFRLLCDYPRDKLLLIEGGAGSGSGRLTGASYMSLDYGALIHFPNRWPKLRDAALILQSRRLVSRLVAQASIFKAEAVLTVTHRIGWFLAAMVAERLCLPLHLINHDSWNQTFALPDWMWPRMNTAFENTYRSAASRLCVSPYMADYYKTTYGAPGTLLYPSRAKEVPDFGCPPHNSDATQFTVAYAGSLFRPYIPALRNLARALESISGRLIIYSTIDHETAVEWGLDNSNVVLRPMIPPHLLVARLREEAQAMILVLTGWGLNDRILFPSKLVDYTATGLPIIICASAESAATRWESDNPGVALVTEGFELAHLESAIRSLAGDPSLRHRLGLRALQVGRAQFSYESVRNKFFEALAASQ